MRKILIAFIMLVFLTGCRSSNVQPAIESENSEVHSGMQEEIIAELPEEGATERGPSEDMEKTEYNLKYSLNERILSEISDMDKFHKEFVESLVKAGVSDEGGAEIIVADDGQMTYDFDSGFAVITLLLNDGMKGVVNCSISEEEYYFEVLRGHILESN